MVGGAVEARELVSELTVLLVRQMHSGARAQAWRVCVRARTGPKLAQATRAGSS